MTPELEERLYGVEPRWFARTTPNGSWALDGFRCGDGWFQILAELLQYAKRRAETSPEFRPGAFEITQVKEKFGLLRFYFEGGDAEFREEVQRAAERSGRTCEVCGAPGTEHVERGSIKTVCGEHR